MMFFIGQFITFLATFFAVSGSLKKIIEIYKEIKKQPITVTTATLRRDLGIDILSIITAWLVTISFAKLSIESATLQFYKLSAETAPWLLFALCIVALIKKYAPERWLVANLVSAEKQEASENKVINTLSEEASIDVSSEEPKTTTKRLAKAKRRTFLTAILASVIIPICSCAIAPIAKGLRQAGLAIRETTLFTVLTPEMSVDAFFMRKALMGFPLAIASLIAAFFTAILTALGVDKASKVIGNKEVKIENNLQCKSIKKHTGLSLFWALRYALIEILDDLGIIMFVSLVISGYAIAFADPNALAESTVRSGPFAMILVVAISLFMYVCASESTPLGVGLLAAGFSPGVVVAFFIAGPASNFTTIKLTGSILGKYCRWVFFALITFSAVLCGLATDLIFDWFGLSYKMIKKDDPSMPGLFSILCLAFITISTIYAIVTTRVLDKGWDHGLESN